jgi:aldehyde:ferredoxin oxidoreductase
MGTLVVDSGNVRLEPAADLLGLDPASTSEAVRTRLGSGFRVAAIGPAGERGVRYAAVANDGRLAGRTGTGRRDGLQEAEGGRRPGRPLPPVADPKGLAKAARRSARRAWGRRRPSTASWARPPTSPSSTGWAPCRRATSRPVPSPAPPAISGETLLLEHRTDRHACAACTVGCEHRYATTDGGPATETRLEYETLFALGSLCGVADPNAVLRAARSAIGSASTPSRPGRPSPGPWSAASAASTFPPWGGPAPAFGDAAALLETLDDIGHRQGLGDLLAEGSRRASGLVGQGSDRWAMHVKGLELPGYDPRKLQTMALGLAVATRGACHNRSSAYEADFSDALDPNAEARARAAAAVAAEDQAALLDSLTVCKFLRHVFADLPEETAELHRLVTGLETTGDDLRRAGTHDHRVKKRSTSGWAGRRPSTPCRPACLGGRRRRPGRRRPDRRLPPSPATGWTRWSTPTTRRAAGAPTDESVRRTAGSRRGVWWGKVAAKGESLVGAARASCRLADLEPEVRRMPTLQYLGHSAFPVGGRGHQRRRRPLPDRQPEGVPREKNLHPQTILLTHAHNDHVGDTVAIAKRTGAKVIATFELGEWLLSQGVTGATPANHGGTVAFEGGTVKLVPAWHTSSYFDGTTFVAPGVPAGLVVRFGGKTAYFAGDTCLFGDMALIGEEVGGLDLAVLPIGDHFTMGPADAVRAAKLLKPGWSSPATTEPSRRSSRTPPPSRRTSRRRSAAAACRYSRARRSSFSGDAGCGTAGRGLPGCAGCPLDHRLGSRTASPATRNPGDSWTR